MKLSTKICYRCCGKGHYAYACPDKGKFVRENTQYHGIRNNLIAAFSKADALTSSPTAFKDTPLVKYVLQFQKMLKDKHILDTRRLDKVISDSPKPSSIDFSTELSLSNITHRDDAALSIEEDELQKMGNSRLIEFINNPKAHVKTKEKGDNKGAKTVNTSNLDSVPGLTKNQRAVYTHPEYAKIVGEKEVNTLGLSKCIKVLNVTFLDKVACHTNLHIRGSSCYRIMSFINFLNLLRREYAKPGKIEIDMMIKRLKDDKLPNEIPSWLDNKISNASDLMLSTAADEKKERKRLEDDKKRMKWERYKQKKTEKYREHVVDQQAKRDQFNKQMHLDRKKQGVIKPVVKNNNSERIQVRKATTLISRGAALCMRCEEEIKNCQCTYQDLNQLVKI